MALVAIFFLGIVNFAMHRAVVDSRHPLLEHVPWFFHMLSGRFSMAVEFMMLLGCMLMAASGSTGWAWGYVLYSGANAFSAWLILTRRL